MRAVLDIEEIKQFISSLGAICGMMHEKKTRMSHEFRELHEVWRDSNYDKFEKSFTEAVAEIDRFIRYSEMYAEYLQRKAQAAERYLEGRN